MSEIDAQHLLSKKARSEPLSEESRKLAKKVFTTMLSNAERREICTRVPESEDPCTCCPRVDLLFKTAESRFVGSPEETDRWGPMKNPNPDAGCLCPAP